MHMSKTSGRVDTGRPCLDGTTENVSPEVVRVASRFVTKYRQRFIICRLSNTSNLFTAKQEV